MSIVDKQFTRLFAPKKVGDLVLSNRVRSHIEPGIKKHLLFHGSPGLGKSAAAKILSEGHPRKIINCSLNGRIDDLRGDIDSFCSEVNFSGEEGKDMKILILDEIDGVSPSFFDGLRGFMDKYESVVKFVATCNYINKVPEPIKSRFDCINFSCLTEEENNELLGKYTTRMKGIITKALKMNITDEVLSAMCSKYFPDFRTPLQIIQRSYDSKESTITQASLLNASMMFKELYDMALRPQMDPKDVHREIMVKYMDKAQDALRSFHTDFVDYLIENHSPMTKAIPNIIYSVNQNLYKSIMGVDATLALKCCIFEIHNHIKKYA